jgi:dihydrofolate reductase
MRKLIVEEWLSLDGFAADRNGKTDFFPTTQENRQSDEDQLKFLEKIDTVLLGRKTYQIFVDFWPTSASKDEMIAPRLNELKKIVISGTLQKAPWGSWPDAAIIKDDIINAVRKLKEQPGKDIVIWGSLTLAQTLTKENLVDNFYLHICPIAIGEGKRFFPESDAYRSFKLTDTRTYDTGVTFLNFVPK